MTSERILYNITDEEAEENFFRGVTYMGKFVYASNKYIFAKVKYDSPKEYKGFTVLKDGGKIPIDNMFFKRISYKADDYVRLKERDTVDLNVLSDLVSTLMRFNIRFPEHSISYIAIKGSKFRLSSLQLFLSITDELFLFQGGISFSQKANALVSRDSDNVVMIACCDREKTAECDYVDYDTMSAHSELDLSKIEKSIKSVITKTRKSINNESTAKSIKVCELVLSKLNDELEAYKKLTWFQ